MAFSLLVDLLNIYNLESDIKHKRVKNKPISKSQKGFKLSYLTTLCHMLCCYNTHLSLLFFCLHLMAPVHLSLIIFLVFFRLLLSDCLYFCVLSFFVFSFTLSFLTVCISAFSFFMSLCPFLSSPLRLSVCVSPSFSASFCLSFSYLHV